MAQEKNIPLSCWFKAEECFYVIGLLARLSQIFGQYVDVVVFA